MKRILFTLLLAIAAQAADFDQSNWRSQLYVQLSPYDPWKMEGGTGQDTAGISLDAAGLPITGGLLWNPLINPLFKVDLPFTIWIGGELASYRADDLLSIDKPRSGYTEEKLSYSSWMPAAVAGFTFNLYGDWDLRLLGGFGQQRFTFVSELAAGNSYEQTSTLNQMFASASLEYTVTELWDGVDLKAGLDVRKTFQSMEKVSAVNEIEIDRNEVGVAFVPFMRGLEFAEIKSELPVQIAVALSLDIGRESRRDRRVRYTLYDRTDVLRENNKGRDTLSEWDCMAIERDYKFFLEEGKLPDMRANFTKSQFSDVLESYLAFCKPENLRTKEKLYASLDSNKVALKQYQVSQEDTRFKQVMASNDVNMMRMFLQYYPNTRFRSNVESKIQVLGDYQDFKGARSTNTFQAFLAYLTDHPTGHYRKEAEQGIFTLVQESNRVKDYEIYLKKFPDGKYVNEARRAIHELNKSGRN